MSLPRLGGVEARGALPWSGQAAAAASGTTSIARLKQRGPCGILCHKGRIARTTMPTRNVVLTKRQQELIETLVESGRYQNASEVLRDGLRLVEQREAEDAGKLKALRAAARIGVGAVGRGKFKEFSTFEELRAYLNEFSEKVISRTAE